jgi:hypothetical protein
MHAVVELVDPFEDDLTHSLPLPPDGLCCQPFTDPVNPAT